MQTRFFLACILLCAIESVLVKGETRYSLTYDESTNQWTLAQGLQQGWIAWAVYNKSTPTTGWDVLDIVTNANAKDELQAYAAGYIEGALTQEALWNAWYTFYNGTLGFSIPKDLSDWLETNDKWVQSMSTAQSYSSSDEADYWAQVALTMQQFDGMVDGYNTFSPTVQQLSRMEFLVFQANDDISDISASLGKTYGRPANIRETHCSALVKLTEDGMNLFTSHVTWYSFMSMLRIYKHYDTPFHLNTTKSPKVSFSSIGGNLESGDDWYITSTNLVIMETSNNIFNMSLYQYVTPQSVLYWIRNLVANRMASSGQEWVKWFSMHNSGTYNNQWIIVDNKLFTPGQPLQPNTLWIAEQIPGWVISADQTELLAKTGYWASYNIPFFSFVYNISGYPQMKTLDGNSWSYTLCPRAQIFARDHHKVTDLRSMKRLMRYNEWQTDPLSLGDACNAISCRDDLNPPENSPTPFGGLDCKVTDQEMSAQLESHAVSGPTWDSQPVFAWTEEWSDYPSYGQPRVFDFEFVDMKPVSKI